MNIQELKLKSSEQLITQAEELGIENAKKKSKDLIEESIKIIEPFGEKAKNLIDLANFIISRNK